MTRCLSCSIILVAWLHSAHAGEFAIIGSLEAQDTTWETDTAGYSTLALDYRGGIWSFSFLGKLGYGTVDERVLEYVDLGCRIWQRFGRADVYLRLGLAHQHEIPREALDTDVATILGVGDGIRHRAGPSAGSGVHVALGEYKYGSVFASAHLGAAYFLENTKGPGWYWGAGLGIGFTYTPGGGRGRAR